MRLCVPVCVCAYVHMCMCAYVYMCICAYVYVCMCDCVCACMCVDAHICVRIHEQAYIHSMGRWGFTEVSHGKNSKKNTPISARR